MSRVTAAHEWKHHRDLLPIHAIGIAVVMDQIHR
jgi:hypothetical protein